MQHHSRPYGKCSLHAIVNQLMMVAKTFSGPAACEDAVRDYQYLLLTWEERLVAGMPAASNMCHENSKVREIIGRVLKKI